MRARRAIALLPASVLVLALVASACSGGDDGASPPNGDGYTPGGDVQPQGTRVTGADGAAIEVSYDLSRPASVLVGVEAPSGAQQVQLSTDATFGDAEWRAIDDQIELPVADTGYVQVFARFRSGGGTSPSTPLVAGIVVDPAWAAATAASADEPHAASGAGLVAPDLLMVRIDTGRVVRGGLDGPDVVLGYPISTTALEDASGYSVKSTNDDAFGDGKKPVEVRRVTRTTGTANISTSPLQLGTHDVYLRLPSAAREGATYTVEFPDGVVAPVTFTFDPSSSRSFAVHANQVGYRPVDPIKVAYVSAWNGSDVTPSGALSFTVVDAESGDSVFDGTSAERAAGTEGEFGRGDLTGASVQELDFSDVTAPGTYRVCVDTLGCSIDFAISDTATWRRAAVAVARAMFHQRSGIELSEPYTSVERPRGFHPDDGVQVRQATISEIDMDAAEGGPEGFAALVETSTDEIVPEAWGGHFDAGDWDRRIPHLSYLRAALDLVELYPETWATLELGIPESGNNIPDVIDEGLWDLDMYRRLQLPDGGIRGGIESEEHPEPGDTSWTQSQQVFVFAPDARSSYIYAGVAAETARVIEVYDPQRADQYEQSALAAMRWAEANPVTGEAAESTQESRAMAGAALFRLTGDTRWQDVFLDASPFDSGPLELLGCEALKLCDAAWIYARTNQAGIRADVKQNAIASLRSNGENLADAQDTTKFGWSMEHPAIPLVWGLGPSVPKTVGLLRGYTVSGDDRLCSAAIRSASFSLGANPLDTVFLTGIGHQNVRYPLIVDSFNGGLPVWPGTPVYGLHTLNEVSDESWVAEYQLRPGGANPDPESVPFLQSYWDVSSVPMMNEFTVHQSHAAALYTFGSLARASTAEVVRMSKETPTMETATGSPEPVQILGMPITPYTADQTLDCLEQMVDERACAYIVTANLNYAMLCEQDDDLHDVNERAAFVVADGAPLLWWARLIGRRLPERVTGSDLILAVSERATKRGYGVYLVGAAPGVADLVATELSTRYPGLRVVGTESPPFRPLTAEEHDEQIARIRDASPDIVMAAFKMPDGERWLRDHVDVLGVPLLLQFGASFDFVAGRVERAPRWMQRIGLEWLHRVMQEPRRLAGRYWSNFTFLARAFVTGRFVAERRAAR